MPKIVGAHHTSFTVAELEKSLTFFRDGLGLEVVSRREIADDYFGHVVGLPGCRVRAALLRVPGSAHHVELFQYLTPPGRPSAPRPCDPGSTHLALLVDDLPAMCERLRAAGADFVSAPVAIDAGPNAGGKAVYLRDPNGVLVELFQPPRPASP